MFPKPGLLETQLQFVMELGYTTGPFYTRTGNNHKKQVKDRVIQMATSKKTGPFQQNIIVLHIGLETKSQPQLIGF